jgi:hypothetical protein
MFAQLGVAERRIGLDDRVHAAGPGRGSGSPITAHERTRGVRGERRLHLCGVHVREPPVTIMSVRRSTR